MGLDTLDHIKTRLGVATDDDDTLLELLQESADDWIARFCGRNFAGGSFVELFAGDAQIVQLRNYPVESVTSVRIDAAREFGDDTELPAALYVVEPELGIVQCLRGRFIAWAAGLPNMPSWAQRPRVVRIAYTAATAPADVREAYAQLVGYWYREVKTQQAAGFRNYVQQTTGDATSIYSRDQLNGLPMPTEVLRALRGYRVPAL